MKALVDRSILAVPHHGDEHISCHFLFVDRSEYVPSKVKGEKACRGIGIGRVVQCKLKMECTATNLAARLVADQRRDA